MSTVTPAPRADYIRTYTGKRVHFLNPAADEIDILDIAHALSFTTRFGGHTEGFYSVAQHSLLVSELAGPRDALWGLLHDAAEAYVGDLVSPLKNQPGMELFREIEDRLLACVAARFGLRPSVPECVVLADRLAIATEFFNVTPVRRDIPWIIQECGVAPLIDREIMPWPSGYAEDQFLSRFRKLHR